MNRNYNFRNANKLRGDLDERIAKALDDLADCPDVLEIEIPDRPSKHKKSIGFEIKRVYTTVSGAVVEVGLLGHRGYGKVVKVLSSGITGARNVAEYIHNLKRGDQREYFPAPA